MRFLLLALLLLSANQAMAWWNTPYGYATQRGGYWPNAWPAYVQPQPQRQRNSYSGTGWNKRNSYSGTGWNIRGSMSESGETRFIMEYRGNIYNGQFGNPYGRQFSNNPYYGRGWR
ncbi:MAG: hypothetical protein KAT25_02035 [Sulfuriflexus sp.]|nr:hypothetical protein [Sulfuriflexus sp.]